MMQKEKLLGIFKNGFDASLGNFLDSSPAKRNEQMVQEETLIKIEKLRTLAPAEITEDLANVCTALCYDACQQSSRKNLNVHLVMLVDSLFDLAEFWEDISSGRRKLPSKNRSSAEADCSLSYSSIYGGMNEDNNINNINNMNNNTPEGRKERDSVTSDAVGADTWKDHDLIEHEELLARVERLERQAKLDADALVKAKVKCMDHELLCEENQRLQRAIDELQHKLVQQKENGNIELILAKQEMKELHKRIIELMGELEITRTTFQDTNIMSSNQHQHNEQMKQQNVHLEMNTSVLEAQIQRLFEEKEDCERANITLEEELATCHAVKIHLEQEVAALHQLLEEKEHKEAMFIAALQQKSLSESQFKQTELTQAHQTSTIEELKEQLRNKEVELKESLALTEELTRGSSALENELSSLRNSFESSQELVSSLSNKIQALEVELENRLHEKEDILLSVESVKNDLALEKMNKRILQDDHVEISKEKVKLMEMASSLQRRVDEVERMLGQEKEQNQQLQLQLQRFNANGTGSKPSNGMMNMFKLSSSHSLGKAPFSNEPTVAQVCSDVDDHLSTASPHSQEEAHEQFVLESSTSKGSHPDLPLSEEIPVTPAVYASAVSPVRLPEAVSQPVVEPPVSSPTPMNRFRFSLPTAPQLSIGKLSSLGSSSKDNTSTKMPLLSFRKKTVSTSVPSPEEQQSSQEADRQYDSFEDSDGEDDNVPDYSYD